MPISEKEYRHMKECPMNRSQADPERKGRAVKDYQAQFADLIAVEAGEAFTVSERAEPWENNPAWMWVWCTDQRGKAAGSPKISSRWRPMAGREPLRLLT